MTKKDEEAENYIDDLHKKIDDLEKKLNQALQHTYVYDIETLFCENNELHILYGKDRTLVIDVDTIYKDLDFIISLVCNENYKNQKETLKRIKDSLNKL